MLTLVQYAFATPEQRIRDAAIDAAEHNATLIENGFRCLDAALCSFATVIGEDALADLVAAALDAADNVCHDFHRALDEEGALGEVTVDVSPLVPWRAWWAEHEGQRVRPPMSEAARAILGGRR